jgi:hypothetical protein
MSRTYTSLLEAEKERTLCSFAQPVEIALPSIRLPSIPIPAFPPALPQTPLFCPFDEEPERKLE